MATSLTVSESGSLSAVFEDTSLGTVQTILDGSSVLPSLNASLTNGTGDGNANQIYCARRTLAATTYDDLDLAGGLSNFAGTITFTKVKLIVVAIVSPDGTKSLRVGPQGRTNAAQLWFQAATTNFYDVVYANFRQYYPYAGWTITAGSADVFGVYNPGGSSLDYAILIAGLS